MLRTYGAKPTVPPPKPVEPEFLPKERTKEELRQWDSTFTMMALLLKNHNRQTVTSAFTKLRRHFQAKKKYGSFLLNKLHLLQRRKSRDYLKSAFSALLSNRINYYTTRKQESDRLRESLRLKAASLIAIISNKLEKVKVRNYFNELKTRGLLKTKMTLFKNTHLFSRLHSLYALRLRQGWTKIGQFGRRKLQNLRRLSRIDKLISQKLRYFQLAALTKLRANVLQLKAKEAKEKEEKAEANSTPKPLPTKNNDRDNEAEIKRLEGEQKTLSDKKRTLERELAKLEADSEKSLNEFRKEIKRLESENEELGFNNGLLEESNQELERELQNRQKATRKKLSKAEIWENVYNNLIHFLTINRDKEVTRSALLECLEVPLVPCNVDLQELNDENKVLAELLEEYRKNFPPPEAQVQDQPELLPFDVIRKQNRYYYMVLEVLSEWGRAGSKELDQLNSDLTSLQKKLAP